MEPDTTQKQQQQQLDTPQTPAAWHDEDDIQVSVMEKGITRKLRQTESEDELDGTELESRLRQQYA